MRILLYPILVLALPEVLFAQGSLTPPSAPTPSMKSLDQIEARTPISSAPLTISQSGSYYLTKNLTVASGDAVTISANNVSLDLNGFTISSTAASANGTAISINAGGNNISIVNGHIASSVFNNGTGTHSGGGFANGINASVSATPNARVRDVSVSGVLVNGIRLSTYSNELVQSCSVYIAGGNGIVAGTVLDCFVRDTGGSGITGISVSNSFAYYTTSTGISAETAQNCYGSSLAGGDGVSATTAENCRGSSSSGRGINAGNAQNCYGTSGSGLGVSAKTANNCFGFSSSYYGLYAGFTAQNCTGSSGGNNSGLSVGTALNCYGVSSSGPGITAIIAIGCVASGFPAFQSATHQYFCGSGANPYP